MKIKKLFLGFILGIVFCVGSVQAAKLKFELPKPKTSEQIRKEPIYKGLEAKFQNGELEITSLGSWDEFKFEAALNLFLRDKSNQVKSLKVNGCQITIINVGSCDNLEICDLSDNNLREVIGLGGATQLKKLDLRWNSELKKLPKGLEDLEELIDFKIGFDDLLKSEKVIALAVFDTVRNKQKEEMAKKKEEIVGGGGEEGEIGEQVKEAEVLEQKKLEEARIRKETERKMLEEELKKKEEAEWLKREEELKKKQEDEARAKKELEDAEDEQEGADDKGVEVLFVRDPLKTKITGLSEAISILSDRLKMLAQKMVEVKKSIG